MTISEAKSGIKSNQRSVPSATPFLLSTFTIIGNKLMQITAKKGSMVLDFYPIKGWDNNIIPDKFLRILTFRGETQTKRIVSKEIMEEDINNRVEDYGYKVTDYHTIPQYHSQEL